MKTPPLLLLAALLFWGWQSGLLLVGAVMGVALESPRFIKARWDLTGDDFRRLWNFCTLLALTLVVYVFTTNDEGGGLNGLLHSSAVAAARNASVSATTFLRWLPMTLFLLVAAQRFSERGAVPLSAISVLARRRRKGSVGAERQVDVSYPYFIVCLFSAGIHPNTGTHSYFWGQAVLLAWALWPLRSRRVGMVAWLGALAAVIGLGFFGQHGIGELQRALEGANAQWMMNLMRQRMDASQSMTSIGQIGRLKLSPRIVIRLKTQNNEPPPVYLREASYRHYSSQTWSAGITGNEFVEFRPERGSTTWVLLPGKTNTSVVNIASYLEGRSQDTGTGRIASVADRQPPFGEPSGTLAENEQNRRGAGLGSGAGDFRRVLRPRRDLRFAAG